MKMNLKNQESGQNHKYIYTCIVLTYVHIISLVWDFNAIYARVSKITLFA